MDTEKDRLAVVHNLTLQWGHGRKAMDTGWRYKVDGGTQFRLQWGHGRKAMDTAIPSGSPVLLPLLQWGHGRKAMDTLSADFPDAQSTWLQWGHGRKAMDTSSLSVFQVNILASLQWGHGRKAMDTRQSEAPISQPHSFNGAMAAKPWIRFQASRVPCDIAGFNGAMAAKPWIRTGSGSLGSVMR